MVLKALCNQISPTLLNSTPDLQISHTIFTRLHQVFLTSHRSQDINTIHPQDVMLLLLLLIAIKLWGVFALGEHDCARCALLEDLIILAVVVVEVVKGI